MRRSRVQLALGALLIMSVSAAQETAAKPKGILLENLTWQEAEKVLRPDTIIVIPMGAQAKEHGPHLKLANDWIMAEYLKGEVVKKSDVVVAPTVNYNFYPAFIEYPGSTTLRLETARDLMLDICHSLARYGPRKFYALNTGVSTIRPLKLVQAELGVENIQFRYTDILHVSGEAEARVKQEEGGTHADEIETSMMLFIAPSSVDMSKAVKEFHPAEGGLTRNPNSRGAYSASGVYGDATLATRQKGEIVVNAMVEGILKEIEDLRKSK
jgi:creatinine amidohydrolase